MEIKEAIKIAVENGYKLPDMIESERGTLVFGLPWWTYSVLDKDFWVALSKGLNWQGTTYFQMGANFGIEIPDWLAYWHQFINHLSEGKSVQDFFNQF